MHGVVVWRFLLNGIINIFLIKFSLLLLVIALNVSLIVNYTDVKYVMIYIK